MHEIPNTDVEQMTNMITAYWTSQVVHTVAVLSLADYLSQTAATAEAIARLAGVDTDALFRLLRACTALGLVTYDGHSKFTGTSLLALLQKDTPESMRGLALTWIGTGHWLPWGKLSDAVRTGRGQAGSALGEQFFEYLQTSPQENTAFNQAMREMTLEVAFEAAPSLK